MRPTSRSSQGPGGRRASVNIVWVMSDWLLMLFAEVGVDKAPRRSEPAHADSDRRRQIARHVANWATFWSCAQPNIGFWGGRSLAVSPPPCSIWRTRKFGRILGYSSHAVGDFSSQNLAALTAAIEWSRPRWTVTQTDQYWPTCADHWPATGAGRGGQRRWCRLWPEAVRRWTEAPDNGTRAAQDGV